MTRFFWLMAFTVSMLFTILVGVIRTRPYNDNDLRAFLTPPNDCPMPCWQGIRPNVTPIENAVSILESHPWIDKIEPPVLPYNKRTYWTWSQARPAFINDLSRGHGLPGWGDTSWSSIEIPTNIPLGDFVLSLGKPDSLTVLAITSNLIGIGHSTKVGTFMVVAIYNDMGLMIYNFTDCPARMDDLWNSWGTIAYGDVEMSYDGRVYHYDPYALPQWFFVNAPDAGCMD